MSKHPVKPGGRGRRVAIAVSRFNPEITDLLLKGCKCALIELGVAERDLVVVYVPGAWELPLACKSLAASGRYHAIIALGAVVRGETAHFNLISGECVRGLQQVGLETGVPVSLGVLTPDNVDQGLERADPARRDKGREAALAALEMAALLEREPGERT